MKSFVAKRNSFTLINLTYLRLKVLKYKNKKNKKMGDTIGIDHNNMVKVMYHSKGILRWPYL